jgi:hypothetical protein
MYLRGYQDRAHTQGLMTESTNNLAMSETLKVPDLPNGTRFCRHCDAFIPISDFVSGPRRYVCKMHMWEASGRPARKKMLSNPKKRMLHHLWNKAYRDRYAFNQTKVAIKHEDIVKILNGHETHVGIAVVPIDPTKIMDPSNMEIVSSETRIQLMKVWKSLGEVEYCTMLHGVGPSSFVEQ